MVTKAEAPEGEEVPAETTGEGESNTPPAEEEAGELLIAIGADPSPESEPEEEDDEAPIDGQPAPPWVVQLRKDARENRKTIRAITERAEAAERERDALKTGTITTPEPVVLGPKPTLEGCEFDSAKYETALEEWHNKKAEADAVKRAQDDETAKQKAAQDARLEKYRKEAQSLRVKDFAGAEKRVLDVLNVQQQSLILRLTSPALVIAALGNDSKRLAALAGEKDLANFAIQAAYIEKDIRTVKTKTGAKAETKLPASGGGSGVLPTGTNALEKAREAGAKSGDLTEAARIRRAQEKAAREGKK